MALQTIDATRLRISEGCALRVNDIDSATDRMCMCMCMCMCVCVSACAVAGKGAADRCRLLSTTLLDMLRQ